MGNLNASALICYAILCLVIKWRAQVHDDMSGEHF